MKYIFKSLALTLLLAASGLAEAKDLTVIRIGWQQPWATQGQLVQILAHNPEILAKYGLKAELVTRNFGPELNGAAIEGSVDVILTADQPAAALFGVAGQRWSGIARMMYNRTLTYTYADSEIASLSDLAGKTIGVPMGAAAERITGEALAAEGVDAHMVDLGIREHSGYILQKGADRAKFAAFSGFDPTPAIFEVANAVKVLHVGKVVSLVVMSDAFMERNPGAATGFLKAFYEAYAIYRADMARANSWFRAASGLTNVSDAALDLAASIEPNLSGKQGLIRLSLTDEDFEIMQRGADFAAKKRGVEPVRMRDFVRNDLAIAVEREMRSAAGR